MIKLNQLNSATTFFCSAAGHGLIDRATDTAYWIPSDAPRDFQPDWISSDEIMNALKAVNARHVLLIADSCYSGKLLRGTAQVEKNPEAAVIERLFSKKRKSQSQAVALSRWLIQSVEANSVFAEALLTSLRDIDTDSRVHTFQPDTRQSIPESGADSPIRRHERIGSRWWGFHFCPGRVLTHASA